MGDRRASGKVNAIQKVKSDEIPVRLDYYVILADFDWRRDEALVEWANTISPDYLRQLVDYALASGRSHDFNLLAGVAKTACYLDRPMMRDFFPEYVPAEDHPDLAPTPKRRMARRAVGSIDTPMTKLQAARLKELRVTGEAPQLAYTSASASCINKGWAEDTGRRTARRHQIDRITPKGMAALEAYEAREQQSD